MICEDKKCKGVLEFVKGAEPYDTDHMMCESCYGTYVLPVCHLCEKSVEPLPKLYCDICSICRVVLN